MNILFDFLKQKVTPWNRNAATMNNLTFNDYYMRLTELSVNMYQWYGLPDSVDERFLEMTLHMYGVAIFLEDPVLGLVVMRTANAGKLDIYQTPEESTAYAVTGYNRKLNQNNSVLVFNNRLRTPSSLTIELYAERLADIQRTIDVNVKGVKTPLLIKCTDKQLRTLKNLYSQYDGNEPVIYATKELENNPLEAILTPVPFIADKMNTLKHQTWNEAVTFIGIESANTDKAERLITDEVTSNLGTAEAQRYTKLNARRDACKALSKVFGKKVEVDFRSNNTVLDTSAEGKKDGEGDTIDSATYRSYRSSDGSTRSLGGGAR